MTRDSEADVLFVGTYPPRECGIATFTRNLTRAIEKTTYPFVKPKILAINNNGVNIYNYPKKVYLQVSDSEIDDYIKAAREINEDDSIKMINIQHEFGIFGGGVYGEYLLAFLELVKKPIILTFHSILPNPGDKLKRVTQSICEKVEALIVMTRTGVEILRDNYGITTPIHIIPHGIPPTAFESQENEKKKLGYSDRIVLSAFGMVGPGKGYEHAIMALPEVVKKYPNVLYLIIGETHPTVRKREGEKYRNYLESLIKKYGLRENVKFYNKYPAFSEIMRYLKASDIYLSTSENPNQITSGTLTEAMGCGRCVVSTPFLHAKDLLANNRGILAEFDNPSSFSNSILYLIENQAVRKEMEKSAYYYTRQMTWPNVALAYSKIFKKYLNLSDYPEVKNLPKINTSHLIRLTDNFGIVQFANQYQPDAYSGYTLDDNSRAMFVSTMLYEKLREYKYLRLIRIYLDYIRYVQNKEGKIYNFVSKEKEVDYKNWSQDAQGRAIWALGYLLSSELIPEDFKKDAEEILLKALPQSNFDSPRALSFAIKGLYFYNKKYGSAHVINNIRKMAEHLTEMYEENTKPEWRWFEQYLTYANSVMPEALFYSYITTGKKKYKHIAKKTLDFLISKTFENGMYAPIGQNGWFVRGKDRAYYDQQPIEASYIIQTLITAYNIIKEDKYRKLALQAFLWFLGDNSLKQIVYNENTGGCHDGIGENAINLNQGSESSISYLIARMSFA